MHSTDEEKMEILWFPRNAMWISHKKKNHEDYNKDTNCCKNNKYSTNLRFSDYLFIVAKSKGEFARMMSIMKEECIKVGLEMHTQKTQALSNGILEHADNRKEVLELFKQKDADAKNRELEKKQKRNDKLDETKGRANSVLKKEQPPNSKSC